MEKEINILEWRWRNGIKPVFHWASEQERRDWERAHKQIEDAELIRKILQRGTPPTNSDAYKKFLSLSDHLDK